MAKREGVEIDGLFRQGLAAPLAYAGPGWEMGLPGETPAKGARRSRPKLNADMPGVMRVLPSGLGKHRMTGRSIFGQAGGLGLGDEVHRLLERVEWGGLDPSWREGVSPEAWKLADDFLPERGGKGGVWKTGGVPGLAGEGLGGVG